MCQEFIKDITPFFYERDVTYVDIGANVGNVFAAFYHSELNVVEAHLFEPYKQAFDELHNKYAAINENIHLYNIGLSSKAVDNAILRVAESTTMCRIINPTQAASLDKNVLQSTSLNTFDATLGVGADNKTHINIVKIDVEGHEMQVLCGMIDSFSKHKIDVIYIEVGMNPNNRQQTYYRKVEDFLSKYDFAIFRIYEQKNEWPTDSPLLRRMNIAFMSKAFASKHKYRATNEHYQMRKNLLRAN